MPETKLIGLPARDTPPELKTAAGHRRQFPPDLLRQASGRLQILSLVGAGLWILGPSLAHLALYLSGPENPRWAQFEPAKRSARSEWRFRSPCTHFSVPDVGIRCWS